jgi:hypothetical protein
MTFFVEVSDEISQETMSEASFVLSGNSGKNEAIRMAIFQIAVICQKFLSHFLI